MSEAASTIKSSKLNKAFSEVKQGEQEPEKKTFVDKAGEFLLSRKELFPWTLIAGADLTREILTKDPILTPEHLLTGPGLPENVSPLLSHGGGVFDAYTVSMLTYYGISLLTHPIKDSVPTNVKVAVASLVGLSVVVANEIGVVGGGTPELLDIPSGVIGAMMFSGVMLLNKKFIKDCGMVIKKLKEQIKDENRSETHGVMVSDIPAQNSTKENRL